MTATDIAALGIQAIEAVAHAKIDQRDAEIRRLRQTLELIRDNGGKTTDCELGVSCNGSWCAEQARRTLEDSANDKLRDAAQ